MSSRLREIAIHVCEPAAGSFVWVLSERGQGRWKELQRADSGVSTYRQAMAHGLLALQSLIQDLDIGPRQTSPHPARAAKKGRSNGRADKEPPLPPGHGSHFGFGPVE